MPKNIAVNLLLHGRVGFLELTLLTLGNIKNKDKIVLNVLSSNNSCPLIKKFISDMNSLNIETNHFPFSGSMNYMQKINHAINHDYEFSFNVDDDCFMSTDLWEYIFNNIEDSLSKDDNLLFAPCLSNGIPSCDYFVQDFFTQEQYAQYSELISASSNNLGPFISGCNYTFLREYTNNWNVEKFYEAVTNMEHYYKGVHPVRFSLELQNFINNDIILNSVFQFKYPINMYLQEVDNRPYMCNSA